MPLDFHTARTTAAAAPQRTDVACFVGYVRRHATRLPREVLDDLRRGGWTEGPWRRPVAEVHALEHLPITVNSWESFDQLFDWRSRAVSAAGSLTCASYMGAAIRSFFAQGGRRAIVVRVGDPWPFLEAAGGRAANRTARLAALLPGLGPAARPFDSTDPRTWRGVQHLYALTEASLLCLPDVPDACAEDPEVADASPLPVPLPEGFVECSEADIAADDDQPLRRLHAPRATVDGLEAWAAAIASARAFVASHRRDVVLAAALPLPADPAAQRDPGTYAASRGLSARAGSVAGPASSAFVQLAYPWLSTRASSDLPQSLEPPDGVLAGVIAAGALARGTYRSVAGTALSEVTTTEPIVSWSVAADHPWTKFAERVCLVAPQPDGWFLQSDVTTSPEAGWRAGGATRMMGSLLRAARTSGEADLFDGNGPELWTRVQRHLESLLTEYWQEGGLGGTTLDEAFQVRCDRGTMTQADLDAGRLVARITVLPVSAIERITVVLELSQSGELAGRIREVA